MNHASIALTVALATIVAMPGSAEAERIDERIKVAVVPGIAVNLDAARVDALSQELADALATELDVDAVGGLQVRRQLAADGIPPDCLATPTCVADVATRLGANQLLFVVMVDTGSGGSIQIDSTWVDPASGASASRPAIDITSLGDARTRFAAAAPQLLPDAPVRARPRTTPGQIGTMSPEVPRRLTLPAKLTAGAAIVGLGIGIGFGLEARSHYDACDASPITCSDSDRDGIRNLALIADLGYLVAVGATVATAVLFATSGQESRLIVAPSMEGVSVSAVGRF